MTDTMDVKDFLFENFGNVDETRDVKFKRIKKPFKIKALSAENLTQLRKRATTRQLNRQTRLHEQIFDGDKFTSLVMTESVVFPDLNDAQLQKSWGCIGQPEKMLEKMLLAGEYNALAQEVLDLSGVNDTDELIEDAKN